MQQRLFLSLEKTERIWARCGQKTGMVKSAGNIDSVLVSYDTKGRMDNFASLVVQWVYISDNLTGSMGLQSRSLPAGSTFAKTNRTVKNMGTAAGEKGQNGRSYQASRAMNLKPDEEQVEKYDHYPAKKNPVVYLFLILAAGTLLLAFYLFTNGHWLFGSIGIAGVLILALLTYSFGNAGLKKRIAYESGMLVPAIIVNTAPVELLVMADLRTKEGQEPLYGFLKMAAPHLPNHQIVLNEKVPCVALFGMTRKDYKRGFEARPLCCGFKDPALLTQAIAVIAKAPTGNRNFRNEWELLYKLRDKIGVSMKKGTILFFDNNLNQAGF